MLLISNPYPLTVFRYKMVRVMTLNGEFGSEGRGHDRDLLGRCRDRRPRAPRCVIPYAMEQIMMRYDTAIHNVAAALSVPTDNETKIAQRWPKL